MARTDTAVDEGLQARERGRVELDRSLVGGAAVLGAMLAVGVVGLLFWPATMNVAMVLGLAPVIGVPLPFFSYGGSALLASMIGVGLLLNVSMRRYVF